MILPFDSGKRSARREGHFLTVTAGSEPYRAFLPPFLPPDPPIEMSRIQALLERANQALGRLDGISSLLPDLDSFLTVHVYKEALLSSQIEGTQSSLSEILQAEIGDQQSLQSDDVREVTNYVNAANLGLRLIRDDLPFSIRLIKAIHGVLLVSGRGSDKRSGEFRTSQNWIGGTRPGNAMYVPPPPQYVTDLMSEVESYYHDRRNNESVLLMIGMIHSQFETIHPFLDGNGRTGRMLIPLLLCANGVLREPLLYPSLYLKSNRTQYYELLQRVRTNGEWEEWLIFYLEGIFETANNAVETITRLMDLFSNDREKIRRSHPNTVTTEKILERFQKSPVLNVNTIVRELNVSKPTVRRAISRLEDQNILREITGRARSRIYVYSEYLAILEQGTEPIQ